MVEGARFAIQFAPAGPGVVRRAQSLVGEAFAKASAAGRFQFAGAGEREGVTREAQRAGERAEEVAALRPMACGEPAHRRAAPAKSALRGRGAPSRGLRVAFAEQLAEHVAIPARAELPRGLWSGEPGFTSCL